jgi:hypothetical protein
MWESAQLTIKQRRTERRILEICLVWRPMVTRMWATAKLLRDFMQRSWRCTEDHQINFFRLGLVSSFKRTKFAAC